MVRVRPLLSEVESRGRVVVAGDSKSNMVSIDCKPNPKDFTFDHVGGQNSTQESVFQTVGKPISNACLAGYNGTIFAYGQTGSGKTFTLLGTPYIFVSFSWHNILWQNPSFICSVEFFYFSIFLIFIDFNDFKFEQKGDFEDKNSSHRGLMPRVFDYLFSQIHRHRQKMGEDRVEYLVKCSCLEIYNERIIDLLEPDRINLQVREDMKKGVIVEGLSKKVVETANDALELMSNAARNRRVSETSMNKVSSRSHLMFQVMIECRITDARSTKSNDDDDDDKTPFQTPFKTPFKSRTRGTRGRGGRDHGIGGGNGMNNTKKLVRTRTSRFNLVDLAGSERQSKTNAKGERLREAGSINKSLTVLGHVMNALAAQSQSDRGGHRHIHYRDSKLTHLLKDSLGGNSMTFMIACVSPSSMNLLESLSTLQFASRAKYIKNKAQLNEDQSGSLQVLKAENRKLVNEVAKLKTLMRKQRELQKQQSMKSSFIGGNTSLFGDAMDMEVDDEDQHNRNGQGAADEVSSGMVMDEMERKKMKDTLEILERENYSIRREREKSKLETDKLNERIEKKQQFVMSLQMQLKLREAESVKLRNAVQQQMADGEKLRNEIIERYEKEERERKTLMLDPSALVAEHLKTMELQKQSEQMMDFIHRFIDDKDKKFRYDQYEKWKNTYETLVDENEELRSDMQSQGDPNKSLCINQELSIWRQNFGFKILSDSEFSFISNFSFSLSSQYFWSIYQSNAVSNCKIWISLHRTSSVRFHNPFIQHVL